MSTELAPGPWIGWQMVDHNSLPSAAMLFICKEDAEDEVKRYLEVTDGNIELYIQPLSIAFESSHLLATLKNLRNALNLPLRSVEDFDRLLKTQIPAIEKSIAKAEGRS